MTLDDTHLLSRAKLLQARTNLTEWNPFLGFLMLQMRVQIVEEGPCRTAWIDERGVCSFHREFISKISSSEAAAILLHETLHLALDCFQRRNDRNPRLWNVAHDLVVNQLIEDSRMNRQPVSWPTAFPPLLEPTFKGMNAERIYDLLWDTLSLTRAAKSWPGHPGLASKEKQEQILKSWDEVCINAAKKILKQVPNLDLQGDPNNTLEERDRLSRKWREGIVSAAEQAMGQKGTSSLPSWARRLLGPILEPRVPWQQVLATKVHAHLHGGRRTFARPGRRSHALGITMPGRVRDRGIVGIFVDVSASIEKEDLGNFLGEVRAILTTTGHSVRLITWDTAVAEDRYLENASDLEVALLEWDGSIQGGGGTNPSCVINHLSINQADLPQPTFAVILTDGYCNWPDVSEWPMELLVVSTAAMPDKFSGYDALALTLFNKNENTYIHKY